MTNYIQLLGQKTRIVYGFKDIPFINNSVSFVPDLFNEVIVLNGLDENGQNHVEHLHRLGNHPNQDVNIMPVTV